MKVRISNNKIRFRLKEPEVQQLRQTGIVTEALEFGTDENDQIRFSLREGETDTMMISFSLNETTVHVPKKQVEEWTSTELVGFDAEVTTGRGKTIFILVEKDFVCMDGREEDNVGSYPNPLANI